MRIVWVLAWAVSVVLTGCLAQSMAGFDPRTATTESCDAISSEAVKFTCYNAVAVRLKNPEICEKIGWDYQKDVCFSGVANAVRIRSICDRIADERVKPLCVKNFHDE